MPGPPASAQRTISSVQSSPIDQPIQVARPPRLRPSPEGCTTMMFAWSQGPRQSVVRTVIRPPEAAAAARRRSSCQSWS